jgi:hypothetical protein
MLAASIMALVYFVGIGLVPKSSLPFWWYFVLPPAQLASIVWLFMRIGHVKKAVVTLDGRACGKCLFSLKGLPVDGVCPECGHEYQIGDTIARWKHDLGLNGKYEYRHWPELPKDHAP